MKVDAERRVPEQPRTIADMYWTPDQMLAHMTVNGASAAHRRPLRQRHGLRRRRPGSLIEMTWNGARPLKSGQSVPRRRRHGHDHRHDPVGAVPRGGNRAYPARYRSVALARCRASSCLLTALITLVGLLTR